MSLAVLLLACLFSTRDIWVITDTSLPRPAQGAPYWVLLCNPPSPPPKSLRSALYFSAAPTLICTSTVSCCQCLFLGLWLPHFSIHTLKSHFLTTVFSASHFNPHMVTPLYYFPVLPASFLRFLMVSSFTSSTPCRQRYTLLLCITLLMVNWAGPSENCEVGRVFVISSLCSSLHIWSLRVFLSSSLFGIFLAL